jgi:HAD superfamily hydrolase (TIGR01549 family)
MNKAIVWDYDGTLVDTRVKNFNVTKKIIRHIAGTKSDDYSALQTVDNYSSANRRAKNWRELYRNEFALNEHQIDEAGKLWTAYQLSDDSETTFFEGIEDVVRQLSKYPNLIFSQNSRSSIVQVLEKKDMLKYFAGIVGYEEISFRDQKPAPDGLLLCVDKVRAGHPICVFFVGDHETDTLCGYHANLQLEKSNSGTRIITIAARYGSGSDAGDWDLKPDHIVRSTQEIVDCIESY